MDGKEVFELDYLLEHIDVGEDNNKYKNSLITAATSDLVDNKILKLISDNTWALVQPMNSKGQSVNISMELINQIVNLINSYLDANEVPGARADKMNITEQDIYMLLVILGEILDSEETED